MPYSSRKAGHTTKRHRVIHREMFAPPLYGVHERYRSHVGAIQVIYEKILINIKLPITMQRLQTFR